MLLSKTATIKWGCRNKERLIDLGYEFTKYGDELEVKIEHLTQGTRAMVLVKCDFCDIEPYEITWTTYLRNNKKHNFDCCPQCKFQKSKLTNIEKYGVEHHMKLEEQQKKIREINKKKYGVEYPQVLEEFKEKIRETNLKKYGVEVASKSDIVKEKIKKTCNTKYGTDAYTQTEDFKEKAKQTCKEKYGVEFPSQSQEIREKMVNTLLSNYGVTHPHRSKVIKARFKNTNKERYGAEFYQQSEQWKENYNPENHPKWKGGIHVRDYRRKHTYTKWRLEVLKIKGKKCLACGGMHSLNVHHIFSAVDHPEKRLSVDNGVVLCFECHKQFHQQYGYGGNNKEQLNEFLKPYGKNIV